MTTSTTAKISLTIPSCCATSPARRWSSPPMAAESWPRDGPLPPLESSVARLTSTKQNKTSSTPHQLNKPPPTTTYLHLVRVQRADATRLAAHRRHQLLALVVGSGCCRGRRRRHHAPAVHAQRRDRRQQPEAVHQVGDGRQRDRNVEGHLKKRNAAHTNLALQQVRVEKFARRADKSANHNKNK